MDSQSHQNGTLVKFLANVLERECRGDLDWLRSIWRGLSKVTEKHVLQNTVGMCNFVDPSFDISDSDYAAIVDHMPTDMNMDIGTCMLKLREAIIMEHSVTESWIVILQANKEEANVLAYFLSIIYFLLTIDDDENEDDTNRIVLAFNLVTMLMRLWRKSLPSVLFAGSVDLEQEQTPVLKYNGEITLPDGYRPIENLFIFAINSIFNLVTCSPTHLKLLTNDVLYDINIIVRMPVSFTLGVHITRLCSLVSAQSNNRVGEHFDSCDATSSQIDLAFSWIYHLLLNTPPNLHETLCNNVGAALTIFAHLYTNDAEQLSPASSLGRLNVANFFINIKEYIIHCEWFTKSFAALAYQFSRNEEFSKILVALPRPICWGIIKSVIKGEVTAEAPELCGNCLIHLNAAQEENEDSTEDVDDVGRFKSQLLFFALSPLASTRIDKEVLPRLLQVVYNLISQAGGQHFRQDVTNFMYDPELTSLLRNPLNIANVIATHMSIGWRQVTANQLIINIWCKLVEFNIVTPRHFKTVALLIEDSNASDLNPCIDCLKCIIPYITYGGLDEDVVIRTINTFIRHALNPGSMSHAYVRALFQVLFDGGLAIRSPVAYRVAGCICDNNSSSRLFEVFTELRLLSKQKLDLLLGTYITHGQPVIWKLMHRSLQYLEHTEIPQYMINILRSFLQMEVLCSGFDADTQLAFFGSMLSIIKYRRTRRLIGQGDAEFFTLLDNFLRKSFQTSHCTSRVQFLFLDLVTELRTFMPSTNEWVLAQFQKSQESLMRYLIANDSNVSVTRLALFREIAKTYGDMALRLKLSPSNEFVQLIATRIKNITTTGVPFPNSIQYTIHWNTLSLLFGKICLREPQFVAVYINSMNHILRNGTDPQKSMIIEAMSDICSIHIENVNIIMPYLMEYLAHRSYLQISACQSLLNLLNSGNVRLKRTEYLMLVSLIATEEPTLRAVFMKLFEENLLSNNSDIILGNFMPMVLYFHKVFNHPDYIFEADELTQLNLIPGVIRDRCAIYTTLLKYVTTCDKFQLMLKVATDVINVLHRRRLPHSLEATNVLTDAYKIIYVITKTIDDKYDTPNDAVKMYTETFQKMNSMDKHPAYLFMNYDSVIKNTLVILLAMLEDIHTVHPSMFQDTFHLIMFIIATFFANVGTMVTTLEDRSFPGSVMALPVLYDRYKESFTAYKADIYKF